jgi:protein-tyrosine-phosphatase
VAVGAGGDVATPARRPRRVLFLCTGNSARSQIAEALLQHRSGGRIVAGSAGSQPKPEVHPLAVEVLREHGIAWEGRRPRGIDEAAREPWDVVVTVCSRARETCPFIPDVAVREHWDVEDPAAAPEAQRPRAFRDVVEELSRRIDGLVTALAPAPSSGSRESSAGERGDA